MTPIDERSANEHDRLREVIDEIKDDAKETRSLVSSLKDAILSKWAELERSIMAHSIRLDAHEKAIEESKKEAKENTGRRERNVAERVNVILNAILVTLVLWTLYKVTGIKAP